MKQSVHQLTINTSETIALVFGKRWDTYSCSLTQNKKEQNLLTKQINIFNFDYSKYFDNFWLYFYCINMKKV